MRVNAGWIAPEVSQQGVATGAASMKNPERVEEYLEHIAEAIERATRALLQESVFIKTQLPRMGFQEDSH